MTTNKLLHKKIYDLLNRFFIALVTLFAVSVSVNNHKIENSYWQLKNFRQSEGDF